MKVICLLLISFSIFAKNGTVVVLEAPIFSAPSTKSKVLQYKRKGDDIYIHSQAFRQDAFRIYMSTNKKQLSKSNEKYQEDFPDPLFQEELLRSYRDFYKTLTRSGRMGYVKKDHVFLYYEDIRELSQQLPEDDETDYRITEPLPKDYPLESVTGIRGQLLISLGTPTDQPYPYSQKIRDTGFDFNKEFSFIWARQVSFDKSERFFFGGELNIMTGESRYITTNIDAIESQVRVGMGPYLTYDLFRKDRHVFNIHGSLVLNFYDSKEVSQDFDTISDEKNVTYTSIYFSPKVGMNYQYKKILADIDFIMGLKAITHAPHTYKAQGKINTGIWVPEYEVGYSLEQSYYLGIQTAY
jgi:hypothetical protein